MAWRLITSGSRLLDIGETCILGRDALPSAYGEQRVCCEHRGCNGMHVSREQCSVTCSASGIVLRALGVNKIGISISSAPWSWLHRGESLTIKQQQSCVIALDSRRPNASQVQLVFEKPPAPRKRNRHDSDWESDDEDVPAAVQHSFAASNSTAALPGSFTTALVAQPDLAGNVWMAEHFEELASTTKARSGGVTSKEGDDRRIRTFKKAAKQLRSLNFELTDLAQLNGLSGFGDSCIMVVKDLLTTGRGRRLEAARQDSSIAFKEQFLRIHGVGGAKADELYRRGIRTIEDAVATPGLLTAMQRVGARHWQDLTERIPRAEVSAIVDAVRSALHTVLIRSGLPVEGVAGVAECIACGSYRRGSASSGDVDILIARRDGRPHTHLMRDLLQQLQAGGSEMEHLVHSDGGDGGAELRAYSGIIRLPDFARFRWLDLKLFALDQLPFATLHFTSGKEYNIAMRTHANKLGMELSDQGLFRILSKQRDRKTICGPPIAASSEEEIFAKLGLQYEPPEARKAQVTPLPDANSTMKRFT